MFCSPLRYPGGKYKLTPYILETIKLNKLEGGTYIEPFAGGCAIAWYLLLKGEMKNVRINDLNPSIYAFWYSVLNHTDALCQLIEETPVTIEEWHRQRAIQSEEQTDLLALGFSTFFLNRTNRSGIIQAGVIGGLQQAGKYRLDCRYPKYSLIKKIRAIANYKEQIVLTRLDAVQFINEHLANITGPCLVNIDPPYYIKGKGLYQHFFIHDDHCRLYHSVCNIQHPWIVTYDDTPEIYKIYEDFNPQPFGITYTASARRKGSELIIHNPSIIKSFLKPDITFAELKKLKMAKEKSI